MYLIRMLLVLYALVPRQNMEPQHCCSINFNQTKALALGLPYSKINAAELTQSRWGGNKYTSLLKTKCRPTPSEKCCTHLLYKSLHFLFHLWGHTLGMNRNMLAFFTPTPSDSKRSLLSLHRMAYFYSDKNLLPLPHRNNIRGCVTLPRNVPNST